MSDEASASSLEKARISEPLATVGEVFSFAKTWKTRIYLAMGCFFAFVAGSIMPMSLWYFSRVMGNLSAVSEEGLGPVIDIVYAMMVLGGIGFVSETMYAGFLETAANDMTLNLKEHWFEAVVRQDMTYFDLRDVSGTATIISTNGEKFKAGLSHKLGLGIQFTCTIFVGFALAFYSTWKVSLAVIAIMPVIATTTGFLMKLNQSKSARDNASYSKAGGVAYEVVANIRTVLALNAADEMIKRYTKATKEAYDGAISQLTFLGLANGSLMGSFMLAYVIVCGYGTYLLYDELRQNGCDPSGAIDSNQSCSTTGSDIFLALGGIAFGGANIPQVSSAFEAFSGTRAACFPAMLAISRKSDTGDDGVDAENMKQREQLEQRSDDLVLPKYQIDVTSSLGKKPSKVTGTIEFHDVGFAYPTRQNAPVFNGFNLKIEAGKTVALVGPSGSGKSTAIQLIERYYDPLAGTVTLDGVDLRELNVEWLRSHIGLVSQEPTLFATTIKENIRIAKPDATDDEVKEAARQANAHDFISSLQNGYGTHVGDKGAQLSGGQKQRIAIARTLITNPKIILLDEATSALDSESEAIVQEALDVIMAKGEATVVVIAHRLSTIRDADMIAVVNNGKVAETGTHEELITKRGKYYDLVQAQTGKHTRRQDTFGSVTESETTDSSPPSRCGSEIDLANMDLSERRPVSTSSSNAVIDIRDVHFSYPARPNNKIFRGLGLDVNEGETLALVGPSGHGKSTIIQLLEEFYRPAKGHLDYNGDNIVNLNVRWYRNELGLVSQEPTLFDGTVAENIKFGMPEATQEEIEEAAKKANAHKFISSFPDGYKTPVGTAASSQMSGGQKQRIAIARALLRRPKVLLLDEATSALDSESERVVQEALDGIMKDSKLITVVIAHRLSTIRGANKIAYFDHGKVREIGTYEELMAKPNGHYRRLEALQTLDGDTDRAEILNNKTEYDQGHQEDEHYDEKKGLLEAEGHPIADQEKANASVRKAKELAKQEVPFFILGAIGAIFAGFTYPGQGIVMANMLEVLFQIALSCEDGVSVPGGFSTCQEYWDSTADDMRKRSFKTIAMIAGLISCSILGNFMMFKGFGIATERLNKRVRDLAFKALIRQEVAWYDVRSVGQVTTQLSDDASMLQSFSGEPIRTLVLAMASVGAGLVISYVFMWEFAFVALGILPIMTFGRAMQRSRMVGKDEGDLEKDAKESSEGAVLVETLMNIRIVAALCMEKARVTAYKTVLHEKVGGNTLISNCLHNVAQGLGSFFQMNGYALLFYFGGWCLENRGYNVKDYLTAMFGLMMSLTGLAAAMNGLTDSEKAREAAVRIFDLIERVTGFLETAANEMTLNLKKHWFEAVVRQDMTYFDLRDVSGTATIISTNGEKFRSGLSHKMGHGIQFSCTILAGFSLAFYSIIAVMPVIASTTGWLMKLNQSKSARDNASYAKAGGVAYQVVANIRTVLALNAADEMINRFTSATKEAYDGAIAQLTFLGLANGSLMGSFMLAYVVVCGYGTFVMYDEVRKNGCDPSGAIDSNHSCGTTGSDIFLALIGIVFGGANIPQVSSAFEAFTGSRAACFPAMLAISRKSDTGDEHVDAENFKHRTQLESRSDDVSLPKYYIDVTSLMGKKPSKVTGTIEFHDVRFSYPTRQNATVFDGFNLKIEAGKTVALVGPSGSGKSTAIQLIERYYDPLGGMVTLDGVDLRELNVEWLRSHVGLVSQEPTLFATTIKQNIRIAKPDATDAEVEAAARQANAHDFISSLQDGYETHVGDKGAQLSGGQKQRIAIARTLITNPKIILLDEATSALDSESEAIVQEALDVIMAKGEATVVVIAHRLSTIRDADIIAVVNQGVVAETGTHDELIAKQGKYFDLVEAQKGKRISRQSTVDSVTDAESQTTDSNPPSRSNSEVDLEKMDSSQRSTPESDSPSNAVIEVHNVHFSYPSRPDNRIFRGMGLEVNEGETLAIVGPSGQGKSTIIQLLEEFYRPARGHIVYNGDNIADLNVRWYRNEIGLVSQEPTLFDGTVAENIKFGMADVSQEEIEEAAKKANAHKFISSFPDGYNTPVGTVASSQMSGGQKQRIAIARALLRKPKVLLLDEATSALDSESEKVVQEALDNIMKDSKLITVVIAHRLSTIRGADKIAYFDHGKVREIGTYDELMAKPNGHYKRLEALQTLDGDTNRAEILGNKAEYDHGGHHDEIHDDEKEDGLANDEHPNVDEVKAKASERKAKELAKQEMPLFILGALGAVLAEVLFHISLPCEDGVSVPFDHVTCQEYWDETADDMRKKSLRTIALIAGLISSSLFGNLMMFKGFGAATESINKRVRDLAFKALIRQEVGWYDVRSVGQITTQLSDDAAMLHSFSGEPIRTLVLALASVGAGLVISFSFMWEFAFVALGILPFMAFGRVVQSARMTGRDEGDIEKDAKESSEGAIVVETLMNIRIVAALCMEKDRVSAYNDTIHQKLGSNTLITNCIHNIASGLGALFQMNGYALMFYFGSWCLENRGYSMRDYLTALFGLMLSLTGLAAAMNGLTDTEKAREAAVRIFDLIERESEIDPLSDKGKKQS
eukprot:Nitzschia sp. Nitz4//scaffold167_size49223//37382//47662//NITZ4_007041-RA/size49223-snap-gene-0.38-mRNA-1//1//CDS//3329538293//6393//frame0